MKLKKWVCVLLAVFLLAGLFCMPALADADDVADAVENTWTDAAEQIKTVVDSVVFPALSMILAMRSLSNWRYAILSIASMDSSSGPALLSYSCA